MFFIMEAETTFGDLKIVGITQEQANWVSQRLFVMHYHLTPMQDPIDSEPEGEPYDKDELEEWLYSGGA